MLDLDRAYKLKPDIVLKSLNEKYWALSTITGNQYKLNEVAYYILNELTETKTINELANGAIKVYKVTVEEITGDCNSLIEGAIKSGLVEEVRV